MTTLQKAALTWVALALSIVLVNIFIPQPFGPSALGAIFEPYLVLTAVVAGIVGFRAPHWAARVLVLVLITIALPRYIPAWTSSPPRPSAEPLEVSAWNIQAGKDAVARALEGISASNAHLIALQELEPEVAAALTGEATGFQFQALASDSTVSDVGLLSRYPILESQTMTDLPVLRVVVDPPVAEPIVIYVVHPPLGRFVYLGDIPVGVDFSVRDIAIAHIRVRVEEDLAQERSVIVLGDFNMTERERAYAQLSAGLRDAHLDAGVGPGLTWRPGPLSFLPFGMLRIDYVLSTPDLVATSATVDCSLRSDHCRVDVDLMMTRTSAIP